MTNELETQRVKAMVVDFLVERFELPRERLLGETPLRELGLDSIMMLDVMLDVEDRLGVKLRDLAMPANPKIDDIAALVERNLASAK
ncbi:MAG: acyl carrier protein [Xanthomonadaceae bacterium]|nr:acyl carrier protein [Xanthomonadaceae bacterium]MDE1960945.1 acyl carrier protein [Xanthomonadaceae bacterium]MDE2084645.1 acyl carrier protein [Xanthomonadaceae bacterium]MDE2257557.1 acyl carrier protein [Xanthomonadaceae bacterium]